MKRAEIKSAIDKLIPDKEMEKRVAEKISQKQYNKFSMKRMAALAATVAIVTTFGILGHKLVEKKATTPPVASTSGEGINIPKIELSNEKNAKASMKALIVYEGKIYIESGTKISPENGKKLLGEKLGTTKGNIDEWSKQKDYAVEFASTIGIAEVYSVKGYDKSFRIMTYTNQEGMVNVQFFECFNGITIKSGEDVFGKLKIENNISSATLERFESWNNNKQEYTKLKNLQSLNSFIKELKNTIPYTQERLMNLFDDQGDANQKFIYMTLKDGSEVQLRLFKNGYVFYDSSHCFFKMDNEAFHKFWDELN